MNVIIACALVTGILFFGTILAIIAVPVVLKKENYVSDMFQTKLPDSDFNISDSVSDLSPIELESVAFIEITDESDK